MVVSIKARKFVEERADHRCEYCKTSRRIIGMPLVIDHILPKSKKGEDDPNNLASSCYRCNEFKSNKTHEFDPATNRLVSLFNPRKQLWHEHFRWENGGTHIVGITPAGRATVVALRLNNEYVVESRAIWIARDWHPPVY